MTQQPFYPPQYPQAPQQPPAQQQPYGQPAAPAYPPQQPAQPYGQPMGQPGYPPAQQPYAPQPGYGQPMGQPGQPQQQPLAQGGLDEFYSQPSAGSGPGIGWKDAQQNQRPIGTTWVGTISRDVTSGDVVQQTNPQGIPQTFRDGQPKFQLKVPLKELMLLDPAGQPQQLPNEMQQGEGTWYVKGQGRDELTRAMAEAGHEGAPKGGVRVAITLVNRRPNGGGMQPSNIVQVKYLPPEGGQPTPPAAQQQGPMAQQAPQQAPVAQPEQQYQQPAPPAQAPQQAPVAQGQPDYATQQYASYAGQPQAPVPAQPVAQGQPAVAAPPNMDPAQQALWARITGGQQGGAPAA